MTEAQMAKNAEIEERRRLGEVSEADLIARFAAVWPHYFADGKAGLPPPARVGVESSIGTNRSLSEHFEQRTLARALPDARLPALFVHGEDDPLPVRSSTETAALIPGARVETIPACGHFPWVERPEAFRAAVERLLAETRSPA
jgi:pimeloyl-ACP methyl ester carboxylesterase